MAWLSAITVIRDAPGTPVDFFGDYRLVNDTNGTIYVNISFSESPVTSCETVYNLTEAFPLCNLSDCNCMESNTCDEHYRCLPTLDCLYRNRTAEDLNALCSAEFINLTGLTSCQYGTLNNFQVHVHCMSPFSTCLIGERERVCVCVCVCVCARVCIIIIILCCRWWKWCQPLDH